MAQWRFSFVIIFLMCFLIASFTFADDVLVKIRLDDLGKIPVSVTEKCNFRFQGNSFLIAQGDESLFDRDQSFYTILDKARMDSIYYMVRVGQPNQLINQIGEVILEYDGSLLLRIKPENQPKLISLGFPLMELPESIKLDLVKKAPKYEPYSESASDVAIIGEIANAVKAEEMRQFIADLQENKDLDPPHKAYQSRFCLRVQDTDDPSDKACDNAADYIYNKFKSYGLDVEYDVFPHEVLTQGHYQMRNVVATLPGKGDNHKVFIISSHYDSVASKSTNWQLNWKTLPAPGADDNASGTAAVLEAARILSQYEFNSTIRFITFSGEELGLHGSKHYANKMWENKEEIAGVLDFDMIAYDPDTPDIDIVANLGSEWLAEAMLSVQKTYNIGPLVLRKIVNSDIWYSDHSPFWQNGYNAILGIENYDLSSPEFYPYMHTENDTIDKLNIDMMANMCQVATATLARLADPVNEVPHPDLAVLEKDISLSTENPTLGQSIQLKANIQNIGSADAKGISVQVWVEEPLARSPRLITEQVLDIAANGQTQIDTDFTLSEWGESRLIVKVNPDYKVFETDGRNNIVIKTIRVGSASLDLGKLLIFPNPAKLEKDKNVSLEYTLSKDSSVRLDIYAITGQLVYEREFISGDDGGKFGVNKDIKWNGNNFAGEKVAPGVYVCRIVASDDSNTTKSMSKKLVIIR
jgi:hypothetical protein